MAEYDEKWMGVALALAKEAGAEGEVPVGAVIVRDGEPLAVGKNRREQGHDATAHAEVEAIRAACEKLGTWRLAGCEIFVTLEPCPMCAGAILNARLDRVVYGARDEKAGSLGSLINLFAVDYNHTPRITPGVLEEECAGVLTAFFEGLRKEP